MHGKGPISAKGGVRGDNEGQRGNAAAVPPLSFLVRRCEVALYDPAAAIFLVCFRTGPYYFLLALLPFLQSVIQECTMGA